MLVVGRQKEKCLQNPKVHFGQTNPSCNSWKSRPVEQELKVQQ